MFAGVRATRWPWADALGGGGRDVCQPNRWQILESCPAADEATWLRHATGFAAAFVAPAKRERWLELLTRRPRRVGRDSHKLRADLDRRACRRAGEEAPA